MLLDVLFGDMSFFDAVAYTLSALVIIFLTLPAHEFAHAFVADKLGDRTARYMGRLTINPLAHIDYLGAIGILFLGFGWAKPVPVNASNFKKPKRDMALTAAAGPLMNILLASVSVFFYFLTKSLEGITDVQFYKHVSQFFAFYTLLNVSLAVFNLLPIPPLDGSRLLNVFLPTKYYFAIMRYERYISLFIILLIWSNVLDVPLAFLTNIILNIIEFLPSLIFGFR